MENNNSSSGSNSTMSDGPNWSWTPCSTLFFQISAFCTNGSLLYLFVRVPSLLTPFTIYIVNLLCANFLTTILFYTMELINELYSTWWMGYAMCTFYQYISWIFTDAMCNAHVLIALNRLWAVTFPLSYRRHHKKRFAVIVCVVMWIYLHICLLPGIIMDAMFYRLPMETNGCNLNTDAMKGWSRTMQILLYDVPEAIVLLVFPVVCYKTLYRFQPRIVPAAVKHSSVQSRAMVIITNESINAPSVSNQNGVAGKKLIRSLCCCDLTRSTGNHHGILALSLMTLTVLICYSPDQIYFTVLIVFGVDIAGMYSIASIMYQIVAILDPIWFVVALPDLRAEFRRLFCIH